MARTALRLLGTFAVVLGLFGVALLVTLRTLERLADAESEVAALEAAKHAGHRVASGVREQYIHQAHTIIEWNDSHLDHYGTTVEDTKRLIEQLRAAVTQPEDVARAEQIARLAENIDSDFRKQVLPAIHRGDRDEVRRLHARTERTVGRAVGVSEELNADLEQRSASARSRESKLRDEARSFVIVCFLLAISVAAVVGLVMTRSIERRLSKLAEGARRVARGDLTTRIDVSSNDEFSEVARAFNAMAADLDRQQDELVRSQKLAAIGQVAAGVAHEINNPLGVILGYAKLLRREPGGQSLDELRIIEDEAQQCQRIVQALLDLARPARLELIDVDLAELVRDAVDRLRDSGKLDGVAVRVGAPEVPAKLRADEAQLRQVISNLVVNAVEASEAGAEVVVEVGRGADDVTLTVVDQGPGLAPEIASRVFDPFFTTKPSGVGLGLAISQAIASAHGGALELDSVPGRGTRAVLRLPKPPGEARGREA